MKILVNELNQRDMRKPIYIFIMLILMMDLNLFSQGDSRQKYEYAKTFEQSGDYETSSRIYKDLLDNNPRNEEYFWGYVRTSKALNKFSELLPIVERYLKNKQNTDIYNLYAEMLWRTGAHSMANENWALAISMSPNDPETYRKVARTQIELLQYAKSLATLEEGRKRLNNDKIFADELSQLYIATGDFKKGTQEALNILYDSKNIALAQGRITALLANAESKGYVRKVLEEAVSGSSANYFNLKLYAWFLRYVGDLEKAFDVYVRLDEATNSQGREVLGFANDSKNDGQYDIALKAFQYIIQMGNRSKFLSSALYGYPRTLEQKMLEDSSLSKETAKSIISSYREIIKQFPKDNVTADARYRIAMISFDYLGDDKTAIEELNNVTKQFPKQRITAAAMNQLSRIYLLKENQDSAEKILNYIIRNYNQIASEEVLSAKFNLAEMLFYKGEIDSAKVLYMELSDNSNSDITNDAIERLILIEQNKELIRGLTLFANALYLDKKKLYNDAIGKLRETIELTQGTNLAERSYILTAEILFRQSRYDSTLSVISEFFRENPKSIYYDQGLLMQAKSYEQKNNRDKAIESYQQIITEYPRSVYLQEARNRIKKLREQNNL
jgi:tetratricopeptide (TPR) repeat protein